MRRIISATAGVGIVASSCAFGPPFDERPTTAVDVVITVVDEGGKPVDDADVLVGDVATETNDDGAAVIAIDAPTVVVISAPGMLDEPVAVGPSDATVDVHLWSRRSPDGAERRSLHFGGDTMLGRRYLEPDLPTPYVDDANSARRVVANLAPISATADWTTINLETVVGELPDDRALLAKTYTLQSTPLVTEALDEMGVDLVTLGNNHIFDWGDGGIVSTLSVLDSAGVAHVGAATNQEDAVRGQLIDLDGLSVGIVSLSTLSGNFTNDRLPDADARIPADLDETIAWQFEQRRFGYRSDDSSVVAEPRMMRIGEVWDFVKKAERFNNFSEAEKLWTAATDVFPELQDWVARRGHGGAGWYRRDEMQTELARLRTAGADMLIVQFHGGSELAEVKNDYLRGASHAAIDAGADAVISHHPHVLQGVEWYDGALIAYSLGNLVFDQGFGATFPGAMLRIITDGDEILEARLLPIMLDRYRPFPVVGHSAQMIVRMVDARTASPAVSTLSDDRTLGYIVEATGTSSKIAAAASTGSAGSASIVFERNSGLIVRDRTTTPYVTGAVSNFAVEVAPCALARTDDLANGVEIGTDLFDWGNFDASAARISPAERPLPINWLVLKDDNRWNYTDGPSNEPFDRALELFTDTDSTTTVRWLARVDIDAHRLRDVAWRPIDAEASYDIVMDARRTRGEQPSVRVVSFGLIDPAVSTETERLGEVQIGIPVADDEEWHRITLPLPEEFLAPDPAGSVVTGAMLLIDAPPALLGQLAVDNVQFIEWRGATMSPSPTWVEADMIRSTDPTAEVTFSGC